MKLRILLFTGLCSLYGASALSMKRDRDEAQQSKEKQQADEIKKLKIGSRELGSLLLAYAKGGPVQFIGSLLGAGVEVDAQDERGTSLHYACARGDYDLIKLLLDRGASIEAQAKDGFTALHVVAGRGQVGVCELLLGKGASLKAQAKSGSTPLHLAARFGHVGVCELLLGKGASIEAQTNRDHTFNGDHFGEFTPLHVAVFFGKQDVVELLLRSKADICAKTQDGRAVVDIARQRNHQDLVVYLEKCLREGAAQNGNLDELAAAALKESAPLLEAIELSDVNAVSNLLQANTYTAEELKAAFLKAQENGNYAIIGLLISTGAISLQNIALEPELKKVRVKE